jgi:hypothetical protein
MSLKYNLSQVKSVIFAGFEYHIPDATITLLNSLTAQIGSNVCINTNIFQKREKEKDNLLEQEFKHQDRRKKRSNKGMEVTGEEDWNAIRSFQATKIEHKSGLDALIDKFKLAMSKLSKEKYQTIKEQIISALNDICEAEPDQAVLIERIGNIMLDIVLSNKTLLKLYADLYSDLLSLYGWLKQSIDNHFAGYLHLFKNMQYFDSDSDYDKFCDMNVINEKRKLTSQLFVYLALNGHLNVQVVYENLVSLLRTMSEYIHLPNKKFEVDEIAENIAILFNKDIIIAVEDMDDYDEDLYIINGLSITEIITVFAKSKTKDFKSLSNKSIFKCMDLVEM